MLVNCVVYQEGRRIQDIPVEEIGRWIGRGDSFVWVALKDATPEELAAMQQQFGLHELAVEDAQHGHQRPKIEEYGDSLFAVLQLIELQPAPDPATLGPGELHVGEIDIFVGPDYVLSVRNRSEQGFLGVRNRVEHEPELLMRYGSSYVFYALIDAVVGRYVPAIEQLESELEAVEEQIFSVGGVRSNVRRLYDLKRQMTTMHHAVVPLLEAVGKLFGGRVPALCQNTQEYFRDVYDHLYRVNASLDAIRETIATALQVNLSMVTLEQSDIAKRLASWAAIFGVATTIVGIWGMNFKFMPELEWHYGYALALAVIAGVCGLLYWRFRKARWL
jgi:magnesium transporter